jgi:hypothetical protein
MPSVRDALPHLPDFFAYAWTFCDSALRSLAAAWLIAGVLFCSMRVTRWLLPRSGAPLRWSSIFAVGMWLSTAGFHALLSLRAFNLLWALLASAGLLLGAVYALPKQAPLAWTVRRELRAACAVGRCVRRAAYPTWVLFASFAGLLAIRAFVIPPLGWDTLTYHGPRAVQWLQSNRFTFDDGVGSYNFYRHFFSGGEVFMAWAMLPFHSDLLVNLASVAEWLGVGLASWALARELGLPEPFASSSAAVVMFIPTLQLEVNSGYVELPLNAALLQGVALALLCLRRASPGATLLCAMSLGVAAGIKLPGIPPAAIFAGLVAIALLHSRAVARKPKLATLAASAVVASIPAAPWMLRAWRDTGYPLSPLPVHVFGHMLGVASSMLAWYAKRDLAPYTWLPESRALGHVFTTISTPNESLSAFAVLPLTVFFFGLAVLARRRPLAAAGLLGAALAPVLVHFGEGMTPVRLTRAISASRFLVPTLALAVPVSFVWCARGRSASSVYRWLSLSYPLTMCVLTLRWGWSEWEHRELLSVAFMVTLLFASARLAFRHKRQLGIAVSVLGWMLFCAVVQVRRDQTRPAAYAKSFAMHNLPRFWADGVAFVDEPNKPHRIAITGGPDHDSDKWFHYFYLGRRFQNWIGYVTPTRDRGPAQFGPDGDLAARADLNSWLARLHAAKIDEVLTFPPCSIEQGWMAAAPARFEKLAGADDWGLFRIKR